MSYGFGKLKRPNFNTLTKLFYVSLVLMVNLYKLLIYRDYNLPGKPTRCRFAPHMVKVIVKYTGFLGILLLSGYCVLSAPTYQQDASPTTINLKSPQHADFGAIQNSQSSFFEPNSSTSGSRKFVIYAEVNEAEEDELTSSKKYSKGSEYATTQLLQVLENPFHGVVTSLSPDRSFSNFAKLSSRYILFCDFRI